MEAVIQGAINAVMSAVRSRLLPPSADVNDTAEVELYYTTIIPVIVTFLRAFPTPAAGNNLWQLLSDAMEAVLSPDAPMDAGDKNALNVYWQAMANAGTSCIRSYNYMFNATMPPNGSGGYLPDPLPNLISAIAGAVSGNYFPSAFPPSTETVNTLQAYYGVSLTAFTQYARSNQGLLHP